MATTQVKAPPITAEQFEEFEGFPGLRNELIYGQIVMSPQPKPLHQQISDNIQSALRLVLQGQFYVVKQNSNIKFAASHSMPAPDVFVLTQELWRKACERDEYVTDPPALVVEVISPANRKARVREKIALYLDHGVPEVWEVLPKKKVILVHRSVHGAPVEFSGSDMLLLRRPLAGELVAEAMFSINGI